MPAPVFGYSMSRFADRRAREVESEQAAGEPLPPGVDPLEALDPELRALVVSTDPAVAPAQADADLGDRLVAAAKAAAVGALLGAIAINVGTTSRHQARTATASPMDPTHTLFAAALGAAIGGVSGFLRAGDPLGSVQARPAIDTALGPSATGHALHATHPAFATLHVDR